MTKKVALICALPQESRPIRRKLGGNPSKQYIRDIPIWNSELSKLQVTLAEAGIGMARATEAANAVIKSISPDIIISTGFCGAVRPGLGRGDIVLAEKLISRAGLHTTTFTPDETLLEALSPPGMTIFHRGTYITTKELVAKSYIAALLPDQMTHPVLEMESSAIAEVCKNHGIPFAAIRAVSDTADQDPQAVCCKIFNADMKISIMPLMKMVMTAPLLTRQLLQLYVDAAAAGESLAHAIKLSLGRLQ